MEPKSFILAVEDGSLMSDEPLDYVDCPHCGKPSPEDFLSCIYCGKRLPVRAGFMSSLGPPQAIGLAILAALTAILILMWVIF